MKKDIYRFKEILATQVFIKKETDYIIKPRSTGYKSLHLYISRTENDRQVIELQIRCRDNHNWATLVEITDLLFDEKLKEENSNMELFRFHKLLAKKDALSIQDKHEIFKILKKYNYIEKLSEVFNRNYINVRTQWLQIENKKDHSFFLIETKKESVPKIDSYSNFIDAEIEYFNRFKENNSSNIVLTRLPKASYSQIRVNGQN